MCAECFYVVFIKFPFCFFFFLYVKSDHNDGNVQCKKCFIYVYFI